VSVATEQPVELRRFSGYDDPRYPSGSWHVRVLALGDATGGTITLGAILALAGSPALSSLIFSLEQHALSTTVGTTRFYRLFTDNMSGPSNAALVVDYVEQVVGVGGVARAATAGSTLVREPLFLGSQRFQGITSALRVAIVNDDAIVHLFTAQGYYWTARSVLVDGGPQRPPTGLYRA